ncbi:MAG: outer membrane beta-barrel family protein [Ginsengibacter sp.]
MQLKLLTLTASLTIVSLGFTQITIKGDVKFKDAKTTDLANTTVSLLHLVDSSKVKSVRADDKGHYEIVDVISGKYLLEASGVNLKHSFSDAIIAFDTTPVIVKDITVIQDSKTLQEVTVTGKKPFIENKIDKVVVNVDALISNAGNTAMDVLEKSPGVSVDKDGNISLKGKDGVMVMIDGKPSYLSGPDLANFLRNTPASSIEQIEVMTNPSSKYEAAGNSGILNIKTKKNKLKGFNGNFASTYTQGVYWKGNSSLNLNYRNKKFNLFGNYGYSKWNSFDRLQLTRNFTNIATKLLETRFEQTTVNKRVSDNHNAKVGVDYYLSKKTTFGAVLSGYVNPNSQSGNNYTYLKSPEGSTDSILYARNNNNNNSKNIGINLNFRQLLDTAGQEITSDVDYLVYRQNAKQMFTNNYLNADMTKRKDPTLLRGSLPSDISIFSAKVDYTKPLSKNSKVEAGAKISYVTTDNDARYDKRGLGDWETDLGKTNHFIYTETISAGYVNFNTQVKKLGIQTGLRVENTTANGDQLGNASRQDSSFKRQYTNLFPTIYFNYALNKKNNLSLNYGRRIDRPDYDDLNPFFYFLDEYTYEAGNTLLKPQFTNSVELAHTFKGFLTTTLNYSQTDDVILDVLKQINSERKTFVTKDNVASRKNMGIAVSVNGQLAKWWNYNVYTNVNNNKYSGQLNGSNLNVSGTTFMGNMNNQFKINKTWSAELSGFYRSAGYEGQLVMNPMWQLSSGIQKQILKTKGSLKLSVNDIFNSRQFIGRVKYDDIDVLINARRDSRRGSLTFSYRFGKPIKTQERRKIGGADAEQNRVKGKE